MIKSVQIALLFILTGLRIVTGQNAGVFSDYLVNKEFHEWDDFEMLLPGGNNSCYYIIYSYTYCHVEHYDANMALIKSIDHYFDKDEQQRCVQPVALESGVGILFSVYDKKSKQSAVSIQKLDPSTLAISETIKVADVPGYLSRYGDVEAVGDSRFTVSQSPDHNYSSLIVVPAKTFYETANPIITLIDQAGKQLWSNMHETSYVSYGLKFINSITCNDGSVYFETPCISKQKSEDYGGYSIFGIDREGKKMQEVDLSQIKNLRAYDIKMGGLRDGRMAAYIVTNFGMMSLFMDANSGEVLSSSEINIDLEKWKDNALYSDGKYTSVGMYFPARHIIEDASGNIYMVGEQYGTSDHIGAFSLMVTKFNSDYTLEWYTFLPRIESSSFVNEYNRSSATLVNNQLQLFYSFIDPAKLDYPLFKDGEPTKELVSTTMSGYFKGTTKDKPKSEFMRVVISADGSPTYETLVQNKYSIDGLYSDEVKSQSGVMSSTGVVTKDYIWFLFREKKVPGAKTSDIKNKLYRVSLGK